MLDRWDYDLNKKSPFEVPKGTNDKWWLKCPNNIHESELQVIKMVLAKPSIKLECKKCNSFAQYGINQLGSDFLEKYWDYKKNKDIDPWEISHGARTKVYIKCQEKSPI